MKKLSFLLLMLFLLISFTGCGDGTGSFGGGGSSNNTTSNNTNTTQPQAASTEEGNLKIIVDWAELTKADNSETKTITFKADIINKESNKTEKTETKDKPSDGSKTTIIDIALKAGTYTVDMFKMSGEKILSHRKKSVTVTGGQTLAIPATQLGVEISSGGIIQPEEIYIQEGDTLYWINHDTIAHNIAYDFPAEQEASLQPTPGDEKSPKPENGQPPKPPTVDKTPTAKPTATDSTEKKGTAKSGDINISPDGGDFSYTFSTEGSYTYILNKGKKNEKKCTVTVGKNTTSGNATEYALINSWGGEYKLSGEISSMAVISSDSIYITDKTGGTVSRYDMAIKEWEKIGSSEKEQGEFSKPVSITVDKNKNIFVADKNNNRIEKYSLKNEKWEAFGPSFNAPEKVTTDNSGNLFVLSSSSNQIQKVDIKGNATPWPPPGSMHVADNPINIVASEGYIYVFSGTSDEITVQKRYAASGEIVDSWTKKELPNNLAADPLGFIYALDNKNSRVEKFKTGSKPELTWGAYGVEEGQFNTLDAIAADDTGLIYIGDVKNNRIQVFDGNGKFKEKCDLPKNSSLGDGKFNDPCGIAADSSGSIYIADKNNNRIQKFDTKGNFSGILEIKDDNFNSPSAIALDERENIYVTDNKRVQKFAKDNKKWTTVATLSSNPEAIAVDKTGDNIYIATESGVKKIESGGKLQDFISGQYSGVAVDSASDVYVAGGTGVNKVDKTGKSTPIGGTIEGTPEKVKIDQNTGTIYVTVKHKSGSSVYHINEGEAIALEGINLSGINGIEVDSSGYIYITDSKTQMVSVFAPVK